MEQLLNIKQLAEVLNLSVRTVESLVAAGKAPAYSRIGQSRRWEPAVVQEWIAAQQEGAGQKEVAAEGGDDD